MKTIENDSQGKSIAEEVSEVLHRESLLTTDTPEEIVIQQLKEKLADTEHVLEETLTKAEQAEKRLISHEKMLGIVAHDLRSPFNGILGFSGLLKNEIGNKDIPQGTLQFYADTLDTSARKSFDFLEILLEGLKRTDFTPENIDFYDIGEQEGDVEFNLLTSLAQNKKINLVSKVPKNTNVFTDPAFICRIVNNLVSNATKFSTEGSTITIDAIEKADAIEISIIDEGTGMSEETRSQLFKEPVKNVGVGTNKEKGHGLGLYFIQDLVKEMGGEIWVESEEGKGSTFTFTILKPKLLENDSESLRIGNAVLTKESGTTYEYAQEFFNKINKKEIPLNHSSKEDFKDLCKLGDILESIEALGKGQNDLLKMEIEQPGGEADEFILTLQQDMTQATAEATKIVDTFIARKESEFVNNE